jgi:hypothetical protein
LDPADCLFICLSICAIEDQLESFSLKGIANGEETMRKRPCRICHRWYIPHARVGDRQMTCGDPGCKRQWHRKKCADWNRKNTEYFRANYLQKKLDALSQPQSVGGVCPVRSRSPSGLPREKVQEVMGIEQFVIIEYLVQHLVRRFQEAIRVEVTARTG